MEHNRYLCAVCRSKLPQVPSRTLPLKTHIQIISATAAFVAVAGLAFGTWAAVKAALIYLPIIMLAEWVQWLRIREAVRCKTCHFDPMLYRRNWRAARKQVEAQMHVVSGELQVRIHNEIERISAHRLSVKQTAAGKNKVAVENEEILENADKIANDPEAEALPIQKIDQDTPG